MKKLFETLFTTANNRVRNPFIGSFIFSWIVFNWKPIFYFLFSGDKVSSKISVIENTYEKLGNAIIYPLIFSLIYVILLPYVNQLIYFLTTKAEKNKREKQHELKRENIESSIELAIKEKELEDVRSGNKDIAQLNEKISTLEQDNQRLKDTIQNKDEIISDYGQKIDNVTLKYQNEVKKHSINKNNSKIKDYEPEFLKFIFRDNNLEKFRHIYRALEKSPRIEEDVPKDILDSFIKEDIIEMINSNDVRFYSYTDKGDMYRDIFYQINSIN